MENSKFTCGGLGKSNLKKAFFDYKCFKNIVNSYKIWTARINMDKGDMTKEEFNRMIKYDLI